MQLTELAGLTELVQLTELTRLTELAWLTGLARFVYIYIVFSILITRQPGQPACRDPGCCIPGNSHVIAFCRVGSATRVERFPVHTYLQRNKYLIFYLRDVGKLRWPICAIHKREYLYTNKNFNSQVNYPIHITKCRFTKTNFNTQQNFAKYKTKYFSVRNEFVANTQQK